MFHIQTEDSGIKHPHIITHLFADGGRIVKSSKTNYSEHVGRPDLVSVIRKLMKEQHKGMFIALRDGSLDQLIENVLTPSLREPLAERKALDTRSLDSKPLDSKPLDSKPLAPSHDDKRELTNPPARSDGPSIETLRNLSTETQPGLRQKPPSEALRQLAPTDEGPRDAPEPDQHESRPHRPRMPTPVFGTPPADDIGAAAAQMNQSKFPGRYAQARPAAIFTSEPTEASIFGSTNISEQSLDDVILSYLSEDLEEPPAPERVRPPERGRK